MCMHSNARMQFTVHATYIIYALLSLLYCIMSTCLKVRPLFATFYSMLAGTYTIWPEIFTWRKFSSTSPPVFMVKILPVNSRANDCIEDIMVTFIMLVKILSVTYSCGTKVAGLGEIFLLQNICAIQYVASYVTGAQQSAAGDE